MSIGIIGGANGPTVIFVSSSFDWLPAVGAAAIALCFIAFFAWRKNRRRK